MTKDDFYGQLPKVAIRLFTLGVLAAVLFLFIWYYGGYNAWGHVLEFVFNVFGFLFDISYQPGNSETAAFVYQFQLEDGRMASLTFPVNRLNSSMVEVVTLLAVWMHPNFKSFLKLFTWCLLITLVYHGFHIILQLYAVKIGNQFAGTYGIFWEPTLWGKVVEKVAAFDMLILRYWAGFPIFLGALVFHYFTTKRRQKKGKKKK